MKCLFIFTLVLVGALTCPTEGCMSEAHNVNQKSNSNDSHESHEDEHVTTVKSVPVAIDAHTFSIIPAKSVVVIASEKPATVSETMNKSAAAPEMIHSTPLTVTQVISTNTDPIQSMNATTAMPVSSTQKPALVFAETTNKAAPIAVAAHQIITATPMVEEAMSVKPAILPLNATDKSVNVSVDTVSKVTVTTAVPMANTNAAIAEHSTEKPAVQVVPEMTKLTTASTLNSTEKPAVQVVPEMIKLTTVAAVNSVNSTEKPAVQAVLDMNKPPTAETTAAAVNSTEKPTVQVVPEIAKLTTAVAQNSTDKPTVQVVPEMTKLSTTAVAQNSTEKPAHLAVEMVPVTVVPALPTEKATHVAESMNNNTTAEVTTVKTTPSNSFVVTEAPMAIRRDKRQANNMTTKKPETMTMKPVATTKKPIATTKKPSVPSNTTPVFGRKVSTRAPIPVTRRARQGTTVRPSATGSRVSTSKPVDPPTRQPVKFSPMPSTVHTPVTTKPLPVTPKV